MFRVKRYKIFLLAGILLLTTLAFKIADNNFEIAKNLDIFATLYREINANYVDEVKPGSVMKTGIDAMLETLDPYTVYIPESKVEDYRIATTGQYGGIGALIHIQEKLPVISEPYVNFPAQKAGLIAGDIIVEAAGENTFGKTLDEVSTLLKGQQGTEVKLKIKRAVDNSEFEVRLVRENIKIDNIPYFGMVGKGIAYIKLSNFTQNAGKEVKEAFLKLKEKNEVKGLVLDLRGNGGGLLMEAVNITNFFVPKNKLVVSTRGKIESRNINYRTRNAPVDLDIPLVVLVDKRSASASEIVCGALQDMDRAVIIGQRTFGKGLVQNVVPLSYNAQLKVTVAKYYIPSGRCIQAIDYSHKDEDGNFSKIPDSLMNTFYTENGRTVRDGGGVEPDIYLDPPKLSEISKTLLSEFLIFNYASEYKTRHDLFSMEIDDKVLFEDFRIFLADKDYEYISSSEKALGKLRDHANEEGYFEAIENEFKAMEIKLKHDKEEDLQEFREEILILLKAEVASRYYFASGRVKVNLSEDANVQKAIDVLTDNEQYNKILE